MLLGFSVGILAYLVRCFTVLLQQYRAYGSHSRPNPKIEAKKNYLLQLWLNLSIN